MEKRSTKQMVKKDDLKKIKEDILKLKNSLKDSGYDDTKTILFGSWAKNKQKEWSDIDVCVVSKKFSDDTFKEASKLRMMAYEINKLITPVPMRPEWMNDKYDTLVYEVKKWGIEI